MSSYNAQCEVTHGGHHMDSIYFVLIAAFYGLSVLIVYGYEKLGRPS